MKLGFILSMIVLVILALGAYAAFTFEPEQDMVTYESQQAAITGAVTYDADNLPEYPDINIAAFEKELFARVNAARDRYSMPAFQWDDDVADVARKHSQYLASKNTGWESVVITHQGPNNEGHDDRLRRAGIKARMSAENVAAASVAQYHIVNVGPGDYYTIEEMANQGVAMWMSSEGHKANILTGFEKSGIGIAISDDGYTWFATQVFIRE